MNKNKKLKSININPDFAEVRSIAERLQKSKDFEKANIQDKRIDTLARAALMIWYEAWINNTEEIKFSDYLITIGI